MGYYAQVLYGLDPLTPQAGGLDTAVLGTGEDNVNATRLYRSVGFGLAYRVLWYARAI